MVSCSTDRGDDSTYYSEDNSVVKFSAGAISRVSVNVDGVDQWDKNDMIGISTTGFSSNYTNVLYLATDEGLSTGFTSTTPILFPNVSSGTVNFNAYYPYDSEYDENGYIIVDVSEQQNKYGSVDFMVAERDSFKYGSNENNSAAVEFDFSHKLAKVVITVGLNDNLSSLEGLSVSVVDIYSKCGYSIEGSADSSYTPTTGTFDLTTTTDTAGYKTATITAILHPMAVGDCKDAKITLSVKENGKSYSVAFNENLAAGFQHNYKLDLGNDYPVFSGSTIEEWSGKDSVATELQPTETTTSGN